MKWFEIGWIKGLILSLGIMFLVIGYYEFYYTIAGFLMITSYGFFTEWVNKFEREKL